VDSVNDGEKLGSVTGSAGDADGLSVGITNVGAILGFALVGLKDGTEGGWSGIHIRSSLGTGCLVMVGATLGDSCGKKGDKIGKRVG